MKRLKTNSSRLILIIIIVALIMSVTGYLKLGINLKPLRVN